MRLLLEKIDRQHSQFPKMRLRIRDRTLYVKSSGRLLSRRKGRKETGSLP